MIRTANRINCPACERESPYENHGWVCTGKSGCIEDTTVRVAETPPENDPWPSIMADPHLANARRKLSIHELRLIIAHARRSADAPEIAAAEIRGLEMAKDHVLAAAETYRTNQARLAHKRGYGSGSVEQWGAGRAALALEEVSHGIARIAELKAKTEPPR